MKVEAEDVVKNLVDQLSKKNLEVAQLNAYIDKLEQGQQEQSQQEQGQQEQRKPKETENNG